MWRRGIALLIHCLLLCVTAGSVFASPHTEVQQAVSNCVAKLFAGQATVYQDAPVRLDTDCPDLALQLDSEVLAQLQPPLQRNTSFRQLHDVQRSLASISPAPQANLHSLDHAGLPALLDEVYEPYVKPELPPNPIDKFWSWVGEKLREYLDEDNWLTRNFDLNPDSDKDLFEGLKNTVIVILIVLVVYILISELRAANIIGLFRRRRAARRHADISGLHTQAQQIHNLQDISGLPLNQQVPALLRYAIRYLVERRILPRQYSLTNREFLALVQQNLPGVARDFESLISTGERVIYGNKSLPAGEAVKLYEHVRKIEQARNQGTA